MAGFTDTLTGEKFSTEFDASKAPVQLDIPCGVDNKEVPFLKATAIVMADIACSDGAEQPFVAIGISFPGVAGMYVPCSAEGCESMGHALLEAAERLRSQS